MFCAVLFHSEHSPCGQSGRSSVHVRLIWARHQCTGLGLVSAFMKKNHILLLDLDVCDMSDIWI